MRLRFLFYLLLLCLAAPLTAQNLEGTLYHAETRLPLPQVEVRLPNGRLIATTDERGHFSTQLPPGRYRLTFEAKGFISRELQVPVRVAPLLLSVRLEPAAYQLHQFQVRTAQRRAVDPLTEPTHYSLLSQQQLREDQPLSTPEALSSLTGVWMPANHLGGGTPVLRGLSGRRNLILVDDIRLSQSALAPGLHPALNLIDPLMLDRAEVLRGAGGTAHGSDALGGTLNLLSQRPRYSPGGFQLKAQGQAHYLSQDMARRLRADLELATPEATMRVGSSYKVLGPRLGGGELGTLAPDGYQERSIDFKALRRLGDRGELTLAYQFTRQDSLLRYDQLTLGDYATWRVDPRERTLAYLRWEQATDRPALARLRSTASVQRWRQSSLRRRAGSSVQWLQNEEMRTGGFSLAIESHWGEGWTSVSGLDVYYDLLYSDAERRDTLAGRRTFPRGQYAYGAQALQAAAFTLHRWQHERWLLEAGLRYQGGQLWATAAPQGDLRLNLSPWVGHVGSSVALGAGQRLTAALRTGARAPNLYDLTGSDPLGDTFTLPNPDLQPELSLTAELGYKLRTPDFGASVVGYQTWLHDLMVWLPARFQGDSLLEGRRIYRWENGQAGIMRGVEAEAEWRWDLLRVYAGLTYTYGERVGDEPEPLRRIPPLHGRLGLRYQQGSFFLKAEALMAATQERLSPGDRADPGIESGGTPGWTVLNLRAGYALDWATLRLGANNLLDEAYRPHGAALAGMGRSFWVAVDLNLGG